METSELTDAQWERLRPLLPPQKPHIGQQFRITMAIDESFWLPTEDELTGAWVDDLTNLQTGHRLFVSTSPCP